MSGERKGKCAFLGGCKACILTAMSTDIYYFTGTGNSLAAARDIAARLNARLIPIAGVMNGDQARVTAGFTDADTIGIVYPVYYSSLPPAVEAFAGMLAESIIGSREEHPSGSIAKRSSGRPGASPPYIFAAATFGGGAGVTFQTLRRIFRSRGLDLSAAFGIHMPQNAFLKPWERQDIIFAAWERRRDQICRRIADKKPGMAFRDLVRGVLLAPFNGLTVKMSKKFLAGLSGEPENAEIGRLIRLADAGFSSTGDCNGCGVCVQVCPVNNISLEEGRPVWHGKCENCIACFNWCPQKAVETKILQKKYYYRHPKVTVKDMLAQKKA